MHRFLFGLVITAILPPIEDVYALDGVGEVKVFDQNSVAIENAVVSLKPLFDVAQVSSKRLSFAMKQQDALFEPFVLPIATGATVSFPNLDEFRHHVYSFSKAKRFQLRLYGQDETKQIVFEKPGIVALGCNIHDNMLAYIYVTDLPFFGKTDTSGRVEFENLPMGRYEIYVWHPDLKSASDHAKGILDVGSENAGAMPNLVTLEMRKVRKRQLPPAEDNYS